MKDFERYDRQIKLSEVGREGQEKLQKANVFIVGAGGLGCPAGLYLAAAGVGTLGLIDHDVVDKTNLHRQVLFTENDIGKPKAEVAKAALLQHNSTINIQSYTHRLDEKNAIDLVSNYDIVLDGTDNFQTKYLINDACVKADKPFVSASIYKYQGQLSVFNYLDGPTYRCLFPEHDFKGSNSCEEEGVLGAVAGIMGTMQAAEALKMILGVGNVLNGKLKLIDCLTLNEQIISFKRDEVQIERVKNQPLKVELISCDFANSELLYLDVREPFEQPRPMNRRLLQIPLGELDDRYKEIPKDEKVHVYCQSGIRSKKAIALLEKAYGFDNLVDAGGVEGLITE